MTCWFCDRCGKQVKKDSYGAGKYAIQKTFYELAGPDEWAPETRKVTRFMKFCPNCSMELEKFLDDEFAQMPATTTANLNANN